MTTLSAADKAKLDAARETDGKFGNQLHSEAPGGFSVLAAPSPAPSVTLPALTINSSGDIHIPAWPAGEPTPEVSWRVDGPDVYTEMTLGGETVKFWSDAGGDAVMDDTYPFEHTWEGKVGDTEDAMEWGRDVHIAIEETLLAASRTMAGTPEIRDAITHFATGGIGAPGAEKETHDARMTRLRREYGQVREELHHGNLVEILQGAAEKTPNIHSFELGWEDGGFAINGAVDAHGNPSPEGEVRALQEAANLAEEEEGLGSYMGKAIEIPAVLRAWS